LGLLLQESVSLHGVFGRQLTHSCSYPDILPKEETLVRLQPITGVEGSDYINANYIFDKQVHSCCFSGVLGDGEVGWFHP
jgi:protein tyrosine phosphatase